MGNGKAALVILLVSLSVMMVGAQEATQKPRIKKVPAPATSPTSGKEMYDAYCASCHGPDGKGDGPAAAALKTPPTDLTTLSKQTIGGKFPGGKVEAAIRGDLNAPAHGSKEMPVWGPVLTSVSHDRSQREVELRLRNLTEYIKTLQPESSSHK